MASTTFEAPCQEIYMDWSVSEGEPHGLSRDDLATVLSCVITFSLARYDSATVLSYVSMRFLNSMRFLELCENTS